MFQGYLYLVTSCVCIRNQAPDLPVFVGSSSHAFRRVFDVNTGLQCRLKDYLYLVACTVPTSDPIRPLRAVFVGSSSEIVDHIIPQTTI